MSVLIDTVIPKTTNKNTLKAFLYGVVHGEYKCYDDDATIAINFKDEEDATMFKLRGLDTIYCEQFNDNFVDLSEAMKSMQNIYSPNTANTKLYGQTSITANGYTTPIPNPYDIITCDMTDATKSDYSLLNNCLT